MANGICIIHIQNLDALANSTGDMPEGLNADTYISLLYNYLYLSFAATRGSFFYDTKLYKKNFSPLRKNVVDWWTKFIILFSFGRHRR